MFSFPLLESTVGMMSELLSHHKDGAVFYDDTAASLCSLAFDRLPAWSELSQGVDTRVGQGTDLPVTGKNIYSVLQFPAGRFINA